MNSQNEKAYVHFLNYIITFIKTFFRCTLFDLQLFSFQILPTQYRGRPILMLENLWFTNKFRLLSIEAKLYPWTKCNEKIKRERERGGGGGGGGR